MNLSEPFIRRPVATTLLTLAVALLGMVALRLLPVAPLPQVDFPTISVSASLPGASPETIAATVAAPLERALGRIAGLSEITSSSSQGSTRVTLQFDLGRDIDAATRDVQAAINAAMPMLPAGMQGNPTWRKMNPAEAPVMILALTSESLSPGQVYDAASNILAQRLAQVDGIGQVSLGGGSLPAVRVRVEPRTLDRLGIGVEQVRAAIASASANRPKGDVEDGSRRWQVGANDQVTSAAGFARVIVAHRDGAAVRLADVARVTDDVQDTRTMGLADGRPAVMVTLQKQPGANVIETVERVRALLPGLRAALPASIDMQVTMDRTPTIRASLVEVERAIVIAIALVVGVVVAFLRDARAALVPAVAVPVSLAGTFALMWAAGFTLDNLSLMALAVATGFVVDDAVVVLENAMRHVERGLSPLEAALAGAREVGFTVLSMSVSLVAVFIPILLMDGIVGRLLREFALTLSAAIAVSLVVSLTTTPAMCARLLRRRAGHAAPGPGTAPRGWRVRAGALAGRGLDALSAGYRRSLDAALAHPVLVLGLLAATVALNVHLYATAPKGFFPQQDTGRLMGFVRADQSVSFQAMQEKMKVLADIVRRDPAVDSVVAFSGAGPGSGQRNAGTMFVNLKDIAERDPAERVIARLRGRLARVPGASLILTSAQDIRVGGRQASAAWQYTLAADDLSELRAWTPRIRRALAQLPELADVDSDQQEGGLQTTLAIDRDAAARLGVSVRAIDATLNDLFGQRLVSTIYHPLNQYRVVLEADARDLEDPRTLRDVRVVTAAPAGGVTGASAGAGATAGAVPLAAVARWESTTTPLSVNHQAQFAASTISFNLAEGVSLSRATAAVDRALASLGVPTTIHGGFQGTARVFQDSLDSQPLLIGAAIVAVYLVLGILYESWLHPLTILSTLPSAGVGAFLALRAADLEFGLMALVGVILLIGIVKKNAILMIDFALAAQRAGGLSAREAIREAARLRLRPILMTTAAALLGALPLALGTGYGAELRAPLGIAIVGGLLLSQLLTLYTTPVVFLALERLRARLAGRHHTEEERTWA